MSIQEKGFFRILKLLQRSCQKQPISSLDLKDKESNFDYTCAHLKLMYDAKLVDRIKVGKVFKYWIVSDGRKYLNKLLEKDTSEFYQNHCEKTLFQSSLLQLAPITNKEFKQPGAPYHRQI